MPSSRRGKYMALASTEPIVDAEGVVFRQVDVKLKQIQLQRVDKDNNLVVSMGLGITLMATPHGVVIASVTQPPPPQQQPHALPSSGSQLDASGLKRPPTCEWRIGVVLGLAVLVCPWSTCVGRGRVH